MQLCSSKVAAHSSIVHRSIVQLNRAAQWYNSTAQSCQSSRVRAGRAGTQYTRLLTSSVQYTGAVNKMHASLTSNQQTSRQFAPCPFLRLIPSIRNLAIGGLLDSKKPTSDFAACGLLCGLRCATQGSQGTWHLLINQ